MGKKKGRREGGRGREAKRRRETVQEGGGKRERGTNFFLSTNLGVLSHEIKSLPLLERGHFTRTNATYNISIFW